MSESTQVPLSMVIPILTDFLCTSRRTICDSTAAVFDPSKQASLSPTSSATLSPPVARSRALSVNSAGGQPILPLNPASPSASSSTASKFASFDELNTKLAACIKSFEIEITAQLRETVSSSVFKDKAMSQLRQQVFSLTSQLDAAKKQAAEKSDKLESLLKSQSSERSAQYAEMSALKEGLRQSKSKETTWEKHEASTRKKLQGLEEELEKVRQDHAMVTAQNNVLTEELKQAKEAAQKESEFFKSKSNDLEAKVRYLMKQQKDGSNSLAPATPSTPLTPKTPILEFTRQERAELIREYDGKIDAIKKEYESKISALKRATQNRLSELKVEHERFMSEVLSNHEVECHKLQADHAAEMALLQDRHAADRIDWEKEMSALRSHVETVSCSVDREKEVIIAKEKVHKQQQEQMGRENENLRERMRALFDECEDWKAKALSSSAVGPRVVVEAAPVSASPSPSVTISPSPTVTVSKSPKSPTFIPFSSGRSRDSAREKEPVRAEDRDELLVKEFLIEQLEKANEASKQQIAVLRNQVDQLTTQLKIAQENVRWRIPHLSVFTQTDIGIEQVKEYMPEEHLYEMMFTARASVRSGEQPLERHSDQPRLELSARQQRPGTAKQNYSNSAPKEPRDEKPGLAIAVVRTSSVSSSSSSSDGDNLLAPAPATLLRAPSHPALIARMGSLRIPNIGVVSATPKSLTSTAFQEQREEGFAALNKELEEQKFKELQQAEVVKEQKSAHRQETVVDIPDDEIEHKKKKNLIRKSRSNHADAKARPAIFMPSDDDMMSTEREPRNDGFSDLADVDSASDDLSSRSSLVTSIASHPKAAVTVSQQLSATLTTKEELSYVRSDVNQHTESHNAHNHGTTSHNGHVMFKSVPAVNSHSVTTHHSTPVPSYQQPTSSSHHRTSSPEKQRWQHWANKMQKSSPINQLPPRASTSMGHRMHERSTTPSTSHGSRSRSPSPPPMISSSSPSQSSPSPWNSPSQRPVSRSFSPLRSLNMTRAQEQNVLMASLMTGNAPSAGGPRAFAMRELHKRLVHGVLQQRQQEIRPIEDPLIVAPKEFVNLEGFSMARNTGGIKLKRFL